MSLNVCVGKPVQYFIECDRNNPCPALVSRVDEDGMLCLNVFNGSLFEYRIGVRHVSDPVLAHNDNVTSYGSWDFLPEDKKTPIDLVPSGTADTKPLPEPKRK